MEGAEDSSWPLTDWPCGFSFAWVLPEYLCNKCLNIASYGEWRREGSVDTDLRPSGSFFFGGGGVGWNVI